MLKTFEEFGPLICGSFDDFVFVDSSCGDWAGFIEEGFTPAQIVFGSIIQYAGITARDLGDGTSLLILDVTLSSEYGGVDSYVITVVDNETAEDYMLGDVNVRAEMAVDFSMSRLSCWTSSSDGPDFDSLTVTEKVFVAIIPVLTFS